MGFSHILSAMETGSADAWGPFDTLGMAFRPIYVFLSLNGVL